MKKIRPLHLLIALLLLLAVSPLTAFAQDNPPAVPCLPDNMPDSDGQFGELTLERGGEAVEEMFAYYRVNMTIMSDTLCMVMGSVVISDYPIDSPEFDNSAQFQFTATSNTVTLSMMQTSLLELFGFTGSFTNNGIVFLLEPTNGGFAITEVHTSIATMSVDNPEITLTFGAAEEVED